MRNMGAVIAVATVEKGNHVWVNKNVDECISSYPRYGAMTPEENLIRKNALKHTGSVI